MNKKQQKLSTLPALDWLQAHAAHLGDPVPGLFYWSSGSLSSVLDNAPTYLSFLSAEIGTALTPDAAAAIMTHLKVHGPDLSAAAGPYAGQIVQTIAALQTHYPRQLLSHAITRDHAEMAFVLSNPLFVKCLKAISIASVFFGANTYIGNGPNFMVKAIADQQNAHTPGFVGYICKFTLPFMVPMLLVVWLVFFRH